MIGKLNIRDISNMKETLAFKIKIGKHFCSEHSQAMTLFLLWGL